LLFEFEFFWILKNISWIQKTLFETEYCYSNYDVLKNPKINISFLKWVFKSEIFYFNSLKIYSNLKKEIESENCDLNYLKLKIVILIWNFYLNFLKNWFGNWDFFELLFLNLKINISTDKILDWI